MLNLDISNFYIYIKGKMNLEKDHVMPAQKNQSWIDSPYIAPVVEACRFGYVRLGGPARMTARSMRDLVLKRENSEDHHGTTMIYGCGSVSGGFVGMVFGGFAGFALGVAAGTLGAFLGATAVCGVFGVLEGVCKGVLKLARHTVAPFLLAKEEEARQEAALDLERKRQVLYSPVPKIGMEAEKLAITFGNSNTPAPPPVAIEPVVAKKLVL